MKKKKRISGVLAIALASSFKRRERG